MEQIWIRWNAHKRIVDFLNYLEVPYEEISEADIWATNLSLQYTSDNGQRFKIQQHRFQVCISNAEKKSCLKQLNECIESIKLFFYSIREDSGAYGCFVQLPSAQHSPKTDKIVLNVFIYIDGSRKIKFFVLPPVKVKGLVFSTASDK